MPEELPGAVVESSKAGRVGAEELVRARDNQPDELIWVE
jgi:hypothetical protein